MRIRQIVFAAQDLSAARAALGRLLQLAPPFRDPGVAEFGIDNAVYCLGDQFVEVVSPQQPGTSCGRHLQRHGDSGYMLILQTDDFEREVKRLAALGVRSIWSKRLDDIDAMHLHPKDVGAAIVSVDQPRPATAWRWGGPDWQVAPGLEGAQRVRGIGLHAPDPEALARRWALVFDRPAPQRHGAGWRLLLDQGFVDVHASEQGGEGVSGFTLAVTDATGLLARARDMGLAVDRDRVRLLGTDLTIEAV